MSVRYGVYKIIPYGYLYICDKKCGCIYDTDCLYMLQTYVEAICIYIYIYMYTLGPL